MRYFPHLIRHSKGMGKVLLPLLIGLLLPITIAAQTLNRYEYWFDDAFSSRKSGTLSGNEAEINLDIDATGLDIGFHCLNLRIRLSDGTYSAISTSTFFKMPHGEVKWLEYWFDGDRSNIKKMAGKVPSDGNGYIFSEDADITDLTVGLHRMYYRAMSEDGQLATATASAMFMKLPSGEANWLEYWFDGNHSTTKKMEGNAASDGNGYIFSGDANITDLPIGLHRMAYRAVSGDGQLASAPVTSLFMKLPSGETKWLEYWFDGNRSLAKRIQGTAASDGNGFVFNADVDVESLQRGHHWMYYRAIGDNASNTSAITGSSFVKLPQRGTPKMESYTITVDNGTSLVFPVAEKKEIVNIPYTLDARNLSQGQHTLKTSFKNSLGVSTSLEQTFTVKAQEDPIITLNGRGDNGYIHLNFNSIPSDVVYHLFRKAQNGTEVLIPTYHDHNYPNTNYYLDTPLAGTYTYRVEGLWQDYDGNEHAVQSNQITITTQGSMHAQRYGSVEGMVHLNGKQVAQLPADMDLDVEFSDGEKVRVQHNGTFFRNNIPLGSTLTLSIADAEDVSIEGWGVTIRNYVFDNAQVTVTEESPVAKVTINGTSSGNDENVQDLGYSDLIISSYLKVTDTSFSFDVKNVSGRTWTGSVQLYAVSQKEIEKLSGDGPKNNGNLSFENLYSDVMLGSASVSQLANNHSESVTINFDNLPYNPDGDEYFIYITSTERGRSRLQLLAATENEVFNPSLWPLPKTYTHFDYTELMQEGIDECLKGIFDDMKMLKKIDGPLKYALDEAAWEIERIEREEYSGDDVFGNLPDLLEDFGEDLKNAVKDVDDGVQLLQDFRTFIDWLSTAEELRQLGNENSYMRWNKTMKLIFDAYEFVGGPYANPLVGIYKLYLDATKHAVDFIDKNFEQMFAFNRSRVFMDNRITFRIAVRKNFHIPILESAYFTREEIDRRIRDIDVYCITPGKQHRKYVSNLEVGKDGDHQLVLKADEWVNHIDNDANVDMNPPKEFWMEIYWWNGRMTKVPILEGVVDISDNRETPEVTINLQSGSSSSWNMDKKIDIIYKNEDFNKDE